MTYDRLCYYIRAGIIENPNEFKSKSLDSEEMMQWVKESKKKIRYWKSHKRHKNNQGPKDWSLPKYLQDAEKATKDRNNHWYVYS